MFALIGPLWNFLGSKLGGWAVAGLVAVVLGGWIYIDSLRLEACQGRNEALTAELKTAVGVAEHNANEVRELTVAKADADKATAVANAEAARKDKLLTARTRANLKEVERAEAKNECPVAPSVLAALKLLQRGAQPSDSDRGAGDQTLDPGGTDRAVRPGPRGS